MLNFDADFWIMVAILARFLERFGGFGVAEFKLRLQADFNLAFTRPAPQAGVRRM